MVQQGGATNAYVGFGLASPKAAQAEARALAIADAKTKAQAMADAAGVKLGQLMRVTDLSYGGPVNYGGSFDLRAAPAAGAPTQIPVGQLDVTVTVEVVPSGLFTVTVLPETALTCPLTLGNWIVTDRALSVEPPLLRSPCR